MNVEIPINVMYILHPKICKYVDIFNRTHFIAYGKTPEQYRYSEQKRPNIVEKKYIKEASWVRLQGQMAILINHRGPFATPVSFNL